MRFGTDGIRGVVNVEITPELSLSLGRAAVSVFGTGKPFIVGRDTRLSGPLVQAALSAGLASSGAEVIDIGVMPTPGIAHISVKRQAPAVAITASHNPYQDNGIKFFAPGGAKFTDEIESQLEAALAENVFSKDPEVGSIKRDQSAAAEYIEHLLSCIEYKDLRGLKLVLDCANGAASYIAPELFRSLGADVRAINVNPNGTNINDLCGSTYTSGLQRAVLEDDADFGIAFDGDADRVLCVDDKGNVVDGDEIISMLAIDSKRNQKLKGDAVVVTVMSNLGLHHAMRDNGIYVHETKVGDRYVLESLRENGWSLGGEQSGHVIFTDSASTGDGMLTALFLAGFIQQQGRPLSQLASETMTKLPQILRNIRIENRSGFEDASAIWDAVKKEQETLGDSGRILLRASGTEPLVRVMVEASTVEQANKLCDRLCALVETELH